LGNIRVLVDLWHNSGGDAGVRGAGSLRWFATLVRYAGSLRWFATLVRYAGSLRWFATLVRYAGSLRWNAVLAYIDLDQQQISNQ